MPKGGYTVISRALLKCFMMFYQDVLRMSCWLLKSAEVTGNSDLSSQFKDVFDLFHVSTCNSGHMHRLTVHVTAYLCGMFCSRPLCI